VPGLEVARIDQNKWAIGSRGFNGRFDNKLLVLIDGRSVYTPLFSGVYWNVEDVMLEDVDRIEVIRGPGATLWGANAVDGVINVITKKAKSTQSAVVTAELERRSEPLAEFVMVANWRQHLLQSLYKVFRLGAFSIPIGYDGSRRLGCFARWISRGLDAGRS